jgi:putative transposase
MPQISPVYKTILRNHLQVVEEKRNHSYVRPPDRSPVGRPRKLSDDDALNSIFFVLETGCQWRNAPPPPGVSWQTVYDRFRYWTKHNVFEHAFNDLVKWYLKVSPRVRGGNRDVLCVDTTYVKNVFGLRGEVLGRNHTDRGRLATKVSMACDSTGTPICFRFHPGNRNDIRTLGCLLDEGVRKLKTVNFPTQFRSLYGDRGYDSANCRSIAQGHGLDTVIPRRRSGGAPARMRGVVEEQEATRYVVEQTFGIFDLFRRLKVRYDGLAPTFKSFHFMAAGLIGGQRMGKQVKSA